MDPRPMLEPAVSRRRRTPVPIRRVAGPAAAVVAVILLGAVPAAAGPVSPARAAVAAQAAVPPPPPIPGTDTTVQRWFKAHEGAQIELNNALDVAKRLPRQPGAAQRLCARLATAVGAMGQRGPVPAAALADPLAAGLAEFRQGAAACLSGDLVRAEQLIAQGLAARTAAADRIDAILEGE
jgi:hypothetical protein